MKKLILFILALAPMVASAQMEVVNGSLVNSNQGSRVASGQDMGAEDMTARSIDWPLDEDGNDNAAMLRIYFENFLPEEIKNVTPSLSLGAMIIGTKDIRRDDKGNHFMVIFVPAKKNMDLTLSHPKYGQTRIPTNFNKHNVYEVTVRNKANTKITIQSNPPHAEVLLDHKSVGFTPLEV